MIQEPVRIQLELQSHSADVAAVRAVLAGVADAAGLDPEFLADLKTAVSEACNNVVLHAYGGSPGPMVVSLEVRHEGVEAVVTDGGRGLTRISTDDERMGLGLAIITALADGAEFRTPPDGGTEVRMRFERETGVPAGETLGPWPDRPEQVPAGDFLMWFSPVELGRSLVGRVSRAQAAASSFSIDRIADFYAINEAIADYFELAADGWVGVAISVTSHRMLMIGGPVVIAQTGAQDGQVVTRDRAEQMRVSRGVLAGTVDSLTSERCEEHELLHLVFVDSAPGG